MIWNNILLILRSEYTRGMFMVPLYQNKSAFLCFIMVVDFLVIQDSPSEIVITNFMMAYTKYLCD